MRAIMLLEVTTILSWGGRLDWLMVTRTGVFVGSAANAPGQADNQVINCKITIVFMLLSIGNNVAHQWRVADDVHL